MIMRKRNNVMWKSKVLDNATDSKITREMSCDEHYAGQLLTHAAQMIHGMHQMRDFVDELIIAIVEGGSMREIDFENSRLMEFLDAFDAFQENTRDLSEDILGYSYGEETEEGEE